MSVDIDMIRHILLSVGGWFYEGESLALARYASEVQQGCIVEIGSFEGRSTLVLALSAPPQAAIYAIDPHMKMDGDNYEFCDEDRAFWTANMVKFNVAAKVRPINLRSQLVARIWDEPVGLVFVDGQHSYEGVKGDIDGWVPHVVTGGILATHDSYAPQVAQAVAECPELVYVESADHTNFYRVTR